MIVLATLASSSSATNSSTAWARSMPVVPTITAGMPRAVKRRMSAPYGTPASGAAPTLVAQRAADRPVQGWSSGDLAGRESAALPDELAGRLAVVQRASTTACSAARAAASSAPTGTPTRPSNSKAVGDLARPVAAVDAADQQRVGQLQLAHQRVARRRRCAASCAASAGARGRSGRSPSSPRGARRRAPTAADDAGEGERAGLRDHHSQAGRLGDQRGVEVVVGLERGERAEAAVLLGRHGLQHDLGRVGAGARIAASACSAAVTAPFMSTEPRPCRRPSSTAPDNGSRDHGTFPAPTTSRWPLSASRRGALPGSVAVAPHSSSRGGLLARVAGLGAQPARSWACSAAARPAASRGRRRAPPRRARRRSRSGCGPGRRRRVRARRDRVRRGRPPPSVRP